MAQLALSADVSIMTVNMPESNNWVIGMTLDGLLHSGPPSPFTEDSFATFQAAWDSKDEWLQQGTWTMSTDIVSSQSKAVEAMGIGGELSVSYMGFSGDAHLSFASENVQSASDVSVVIKAAAAGKKQQMSLAETNVLDLKETSVDSLDEFLALYGSYLIVGFEYGGEILFQSTHSARSEDDKMAIEGGLEISFAGASFPGFELSGSANVEYEKSDISRSISDKKSFSIRPNTDSDDANELINALTDISLGGMADDPTLYETLAQNAQNILSGDFVDPIKAVVIPLSSVSAVSDLFVDNADSEDTAPFFSFLNEMYMAVEALSRQLELVEQEWRSLSADTVSTVRSTWGDWEFRLLALREEMAVINNINDVIDGSNAYMAISATKDWDADVLEAQSFIEITATGLENQFEVAIIEPYNDMLESLTTTTMPPDGDVCEYSYADYVSKCDGSQDWHWIVDGDVSDYDKADECTMDSARNGVAMNAHGDAIAVQCCDGSTTAIRDIPGVGCTSGATFGEAQQICEDAGYRLCFKDEVLAGYGAGQGCDFDGYHVWTSTTCEGWHWIADGDVDEGELKSDECTADSARRGVAANAFGDKIGVQCCDDRTSPVTPIHDVPGVGCTSGATYAEAKQICDSAGYRLCSRSEVLSRYGPTATLSAFCDNWGTLAVSYDAGATFDEVTGVRHGWDYVYSIDNVAESTVLRYSCEDGGGAGGYMATVEVNGAQYSTTNPLSAGEWELVSSSDNDVSSLIYTDQSGWPWNLDAAARSRGLAADAYWVWNSNTFNTMVFSFRFADTHLFDTGCPFGEYHVWTSSECDPEDAAVSSAAASSVHLLGAKATTPRSMPTQAVTIDLSSSWAIGCIALLAVLCLMNLICVARARSNGGARKYAAVQYADSEEFTEHEAKAINVNE